jgi:hypothetical protein
MLEPIQDNDNYKPHAKNYSNLYIMEIFEARVLGGNLSFWVKNHQY